MSVFWYINVHILKRPNGRRSIEKKLQSQFFVGGRKKLWLVSHKSWKNRVLKSPAQTAFWTFIWTFSKVAGFATFWGNLSFFHVLVGFQIFETEYAHSFIFKANIFGRKVSDHHSSMVWNLEVWNSLVLLVFKRNIFGWKVSEHNDSVVWNLEVWNSLDSLVFERNIFGGNIKIHRLYASMDSMDYIS